MATGVCLFLVVVALSATGLQAEEGRGEDGELTLQQFINQARSLDIITDEQALSLRTLAGEMGGERALHAKLSEAEKKKEEGYLAVGSSVFMKMYNRLTLLNVLYFSGALLTMGAYTLFMTLAWETYGFGGIGTFMLFQVLGLGGLGLKLWTSGDYQFLGGLLCSVSTTMVPFTVYSIERALDWWPKEDPGMFQNFRTYVRGGWVVMEVATILTGMAYLSVVRFPFLLCPVAWMLWFLSMDLAPFLPEWYKGWRGMFEARRQLSVAFGLGMIITGRILELKLGADPDFGYWLYLFGLVSFWFAVTFDFPEYDLHGSLYLLLNIALCLVGSHLNRTTFHVFATMGVIIYAVGIGANHIKMESSFLLWFLKAFAAVGLFSQALHTGGNIEILAALVCLFAFDFNAIRFLGSGEHYYLFLLATNLGFMACVPSFQRPIDLWFFVFPDASWPVGLVCSLSVAIFHAGLLKYSFSPLNQNVPMLYHLYRLVASICLALTFVFFRQPAYSWVGGLGVPLVAANLSLPLRQIIRERRIIDETEEKLHIKLAAFLILFLGITLAIYLETNILYFVCCMAMLVFVLHQLDDWKIGGCLLAIILILLSVPLQSKFIIVIGAIYIFCYLSYLAYDKFKNSLLFPLVLVGMGIAIIYLGYLYQSNEAAVQALFEQFTPNIVKVILNRPLSTDWRPFGALDWYHYIKQAEFSFASVMKVPFSWAVWPAALTHALSKGTIPYVSYLCAIGIALLIFALAISKFRQSLVEHLHESVEARNITIGLSQDPAHNKHGIVVKVKGKKPSELARPVHIALDISGSVFWRAAASTFGEWKVGLARSMFLPLTLTPNLISFTGFKKGSTDFTATILLGTGHKGSAKLSHATASRTLQSLKSNNQDVKMTCIVLYSNTWYSPYSKLCEKEIVLRNITF